MTFTFYKVTKHGIGHPVVARMTVQTMEVIKFSGLSKQQEGEVAKLYIDTLQPRLLKCSDVFDRLSKALDESVARVKPHEGGQLREVPHVPELRGEVEAFLYEVKNYLRDLTSFFRICFDCDLKKASDLYDAKGNGDSKLVKWATRKFGPDHNFTKMLRSEQPWIGQVIQQRNAVDHPGGTSGTLVTYNVRPHKDGWVPPAWSREGGPESDILMDMAGIMHNMLTFAEDLLVECIMHTTPFPAIALYEIPEAQRDPTNPKRITVGLKPWVRESIDKENATKLAQQTDDKI